MAKFNPFAPEHRDQYNQIKNLSSRQIIDYVNATTGQVIDIDPKNKARIIRKAIEYLKKYHPYKRIFKPLTDIELATLTKGDKVYILDKDSLFERTGETFDNLKIILGRIVTILDTDLHLCYVSVSLKEKVHVYDAPDVILGKIVSLVKRNDSKENFNDSELDIKEVEIESTFKRMSKSEMIRHAKENLGVNIGGIFNGLFVSEKVVARRFQDVCNGRKP